MAKSGILTYPLLKIKKSIILCSNMTLARAYRRVESCLRSHFVELLMLYRYIYLSFRITPEKNLKRQNTVRKSAHF